MIPTVDNIPVLLPAHEHPDFGDPGMHYHIDYRYMGGPPRQSQVIFSDSPVVYQDLPLRREVYQIELDSFSLPWGLGKRYDKCGHVCPHKGLPMMDIGNGIRQCVGHGICARGKEVIKDFYLDVCGVRVPYNGYGRYSLMFDGDVDAYHITLVTEDGVPVGKHVFDAPIMLSAGDFLNLLLS